MLSNSSVSVSLPMVDLNRAKEFYKEKLGLKLIEELEGVLVFEAGNGTKLVLYQREPSKADHTVAGFEVEDIEAEVKELKEKGVVFEEYDNPPIKTVDGIATKGELKAAWFKDSEGNILGLTQGN